MSAPISTYTLDGDEQGRFIRRLLAILRAARLNHHYPDPRRLGGHLRAMSPEVHRGLYDGLQINLQSGLPTYREWTRVQTDVSIAADQLQKLGDRRSLAKKAAESDHSIHDEQLAKYDYYDAIADIRLAPLGAMDVALRRVDPDNNTAYFQILFDKLDASGLFIRTSIELRQRASVWDTRAVELDDDTASYTEEFKSLIYKFSAMDAEFTFTKLSTLNGVDVQRVSRATLGPIYDGRCQIPSAFDDLIGDDPERLLAHFAIDSAALDVDEHRNNDPFDDLFGSTIADELRSTYRKARRQFGYHVYRDRKFVVSRQLQPQLRDLCAAEGTKNIIYPL